MGWQAERYHDISVGHRVHNQGSKCELLHGHNYRIHFHCVADQLDDVGRVIDFGDIKSSLCMWLEDNWDHKFLAWDKDPMMHGILSAAEACALNDTAANLRNSIVWVPFNPTAENMAEHLVRVVAPQQLAGTGIAVRLCRVEETRKCFASYSLD